MILIGSGSLVMRGTPTSKHRALGSSIFLRSRSSLSFGSIQSWYGGITRLGTTAAGALATAASPGRAALAFSEPTANARPLAPPPCQTPDMSGFPSAVRGTGGFGGTGFGASCAPTRSVMTSEANATRLRIASVYIILLVFRAGDGIHRLPKELHVLIRSLFENPFLIAVRSEAFGPVLFVHHRAHAVALHALGPKERHVGGAGLHQGYRDHAINALEGGFNGLIRVRIQARWRGARPLIRGLRHQFDRWIVDHLAHHVVEPGDVLVRQRANVERGF